MRRKLLSIILALTMALGMLPAAALAAEPLPEDAAPAKWDTLTLQKADGTALKEGTDYTVTDGTYYHYAYSESFKYHIYNVTTSDPIVIGGGAQYKNESLTYPLKSRVTLGDAVTSVTLSDVTALGELSIADGSSVTFTLAGENCVDHIYGKGAATNMIFDGEGSLTGKHIGGINKYGADPAANVGCNITINSGTFNITAGYESAIGGGQNGNAGKITINGGNITAKSDYGAAIGGGQAGKASTIIINDGEINATGSFGAAIGGGQDGKAEKIAIKGGSITARGSHVGAAIGGGQNGDAGTIEISGGDLNVTARNMAIGGQNADTITISGGNIKLGKLNSSSKEIPADASQIGAAKGGTADQIKISGGSFNVSIPKDYCEAGFDPKDAGNGNYTVEDNRPIEINGQRYSTLDDAITAAKDGDTITLLKDVTDGDGVIVPSGKNFTLDFDTHTYTVTRNLAGSTGTKTQCFQLLKDSTLTFKNGTIKANNENVAMIIQNYSNLTLENMLLDGASITRNDATIYTMSNNCGNVVIKDTTINTVSNGVAFDVYGGFGNYSDVTVTVTGSSEINGKIEVARDSGTQNKNTLNINGGTINGELKIDSSIKPGDATAITKTENVSLTAPSGYTWTEVGNTEVLVKENSVAVVNGVGYATLAEALDAVKETGGTITLLKDADLEDAQYTINKSVTINGSGKISCTVGTGETTRAFVVENNGSLTLDGVELDIRGTTNNDPAKKNDGTGIDVQYGGSLVLKNRAVLNLHDLERATISSKPDGSQANPGQFVIDNSTFNSTNIDGNISNGGDWKVTNGSTVNINNCGSYGLSVDSLTTKQSTVNASGTGYSAIYGKDLQFKDGSNVLISGAGTKLPLISKWSDARSPIQTHKDGGTIVVESGATVTVQDCVDKDEKANNTIYLPNNTTYTNNGTVNATIITADAPENSFVVTLVSDGKTIGVQTVSKDSEFTLPAAPEKNNYTFNGWYDGSKTYKAGDKATITENTTFTAQWSYISSSSRYNVTAPKADHGTVTVSPKRASKGDTVTVTVKPDSGYVLETLTVTDKNGNELTLKDKGDGKYTFTMPRSAVTVKATFEEDNSVLNFFYDVPNDAYYYEAVKWAVEKGITSGIGNDLFGSNDPCTRAQIVTFLWRAAGSPEPKALSSFTDVPADAWYAKAVAWAVENGVTAGVGDDLFGSGDTCTRAQSVTFLFKALKAAAKGQADFKDVSASDWYAQAVAWAVENGVTAGVGGGLFGSGDDCTRAQIVTFLFKAYQGK